MQPPELQCRQFVQLLLLPRVLDACPVGASLVKEALQAGRTNLCRHQALAGRRERLQLRGDNTLLHVNGLLQTGHEVVVVLHDLRVGRAACPQRPVGRMACTTSKRCAWASSLS